MILGLYLPLKYFIIFLVKENLYKQINRDIIGNERALSRHFTSSEMALALNNLKRVDTPFWRH